MEASLLMWYLKKRLRGHVFDPTNLVLTSAGSTYNRGNLTATNAFFWSSLDLSPYHGTDAGSTPYYIEVLDGAGKKATGYLAAVGAGETLGSELLNEFSNYGSSYSTFTISGKDITSAISSGYGLCYAAYSSTPNQLIKYVNNLTLNSGNIPDFGWTPASGGGDPSLYISPLLSGNNSYYRTMMMSTSYVIFYNASAANYSCTHSMKQVTDPPSTAVHVVSSLNGTTRNWASIESGFDPNTIASWNIYG